MLYTLLVVSCCCAVTLSQIPTSIRETGFSDQYKSENTLGEYTFGYNEDHTTGGSFRREVSDRLGNKFGSYGLRVGDGRVRIVNYVADRDGFRADVFSNEPGVRSHHPNRFSSVTRKGILSVLVPGFRYSSIPPRVTFQGPPRPDSFGDGMLVEEGYNFEAEVKRFQGQHVTDDHYASEVGPTSFQDGEFEDGRRHLSNLHADQGEALKDAFLDGQYSHESGIVAPNRTASLQEDQKQAAASESSAEVPSPTSVSERTDDSFRNQKKLDHANRYRTESATTAFDDLSSFQSAVVMSKEMVTPPDKKDATLHENVGSNAENTVTSSTEAVTEV